MKKHFIHALLLLVAQVVIAQPYEGPDTLWTRVHPLPDLESFLATNVVLLTDGGMMISGDYVTAGETDWGPCMVRLDSNGSLLWRRPSHDSILVTHYPTHMCQIGPDRFVLAGYRVGDQGDPCVTLCDGEGAIIWRRPFAMQYWQWVRGVCPSGDGGAAVLFDTENFQTGSRVMQVMKIDSLGNREWVHSYPISGGDASVGAIAPTADGGYAFVGSSWRWTEVHPFFLVKLDADGNVEFTRSYNFSFDESGARGVAELTNGDYVICGYAMSYQTSYIQALLVRVSANGDSLWSWLSDPNDWQAYEVLATSDGGFVARLTSNMYMRFSPSGILLWQREYSPSPYHFYDTWETVSDERGRFIIAGAAISDTFNGYYVAAIKTQPDPVAANDPRPILLPGSITLKTYPNPFNSTTQIEFTLPTTQRVSLRLYDVLGREVAVLVNEIKMAGEHRVMFDAAGLASGVYLCRIEAGSFAQTRKMVLLK